MLISADEREEKIEQSEHVETLVEMFKKERADAEGKYNIKATTTYALEKMTQLMSDNYATLQTESDEQIDELKSNAPKMNKKARDRTKKQKICIESIEEKLVK